MGSNKTQKTTKNEQVSCEKFCEELVKFLNENAPVCEINSEELGEDDQKKFQYYHNLLICYTELLQLGQTKKNLINTYLKTFAKKSNGDPEPYDSNDSDTYLSNMIDNDSDDNKKSSKEKVIIEKVNYDSDTDTDKKTVSSKKDKSVKKDKKKSKSEKKNKPESESETVSVSVKKDKKESKSEKEKKAESDSESETETVSAKKDKKKSKPESDSESEPETVSAKKDKKKSKSESDSEPVKKDKKKSKSKS